MGRESGLDLSELDAEASDLDLVVEPAQAFQDRGGRVVAEDPAYEVAGAVEDVTIDEGGGDEAAVGEVVPAPVARGDSGATDDQLTCARAQGV